MPRAFCPDCGSEVPVDADGLCHVGHAVDLGPGSASSDELEVEFGPASADPDEPQPWVGNVDDPPPASSESDELASAAGSVPDDEEGWPRSMPSEGEVPGWTPPTNDPVAPPPAPAPAPADPPAWSGGDLDLDGLDDLEAAISELEMDDGAAPAAEATPPDPDATARPSAAPDAVAPTTEIDTGAVHAEASEGDGTTAPDDAPPAGTADDAGPVDLSNFTAKGGRKGGRRRRR